MVIKVFPLIGGSDHGIFNDATLSFDGEIVKIPPFLGKGDITDGPLHHDLLNFVNFLIPLVVCCQFFLEVFGQVCVWISGWGLYFLPLDLLFNLPLFLLLSLLHLENLLHLSNLFFRSRVVFIKDPELLSGKHHGQEDGEVEPLVVRFMAHLLLVARMKLELVVIRWRHSSLRLLLLLLTLKL